MAKASATTAPADEPSPKTGPNGLIVLPLTNFPALNPTGEFAEALKANVELAGESITADNLTRIKTPAGGSVRWEIPSAGGVETTEEIRGILVNFQKHGILWPSDDPKPGAQPVLRTFDLQTAEQFGPVPDDMAETLNKHRIDERRFNWPNLPWNQWGSGKGGAGKRCKEQRQLFILREGDLFPLLVTVQPGSLRNVTNWFNDLSKAGVPFYRAVVALRLEKVANRAGQPFSRIVPKLVATISQEDGRTILEKFTEPIRGIVRDIEVVDGGEGEE